jgi:glycosyltransferase involved in cell wall biosynthesis
MHRSRPNIAFVTSRNGLSRQSNAHFYLAQAIREHIGDVSILCPQTLPSLRSEAKRVRRIIRRLLRLSDAQLTGHTFAMAVNEALTRMPYDLVVAPMGSSYIPLLETDAPIIYLSDATQHLLFDYYDNRSCVSTERRRADDEAERESIARAAHISYPSGWARRSAIDDYDANPAKISVIPWGANIEADPPRDAVLAPRTSEQCELLFLGTQWERKGGPFAVEVFHALRGRGVPARLTICGTRPDGLEAIEGISVMGRLNKDDPKERDLLEGFLLNSDLLLFPTVADCSPHVLCEAGAFGLPVVARATGGVPEVVTTGINGILMDPSATPPEYAERIEEMWALGRSGQPLAASCRDNYEQRLSWAAWGRRFGDVARSLASGSIPSYPGARLEDS